MGGRGAGSKKKGGGGGGSAIDAILDAVKGMSKASIKQMGRSSIEGIAEAVYIKRAMAQGLSMSEASYRARSLMSGNTTTQLVNYVHKYAK